MVTIKETHWANENNRNRESRIIHYSSWDEYVNSLLTIDGQKGLPYQSLPRQSKLTKVMIMNDRIIEGTYMHPLLEIA